MPMAHFKSLVDQAKDLGASLISVFGYGEPLLDDEVVDKVQYCTDKGLDTFITSNGSLLTLDIAYALLKAGLKHMRFSVHGFYKTYEDVHRGLVFEDVLRKVSNFKHVADTKKTGCKVSISCIPMGGEKINDIIEFWKNFELEIWKPHNWGAGRDYRTVVRKKKTCGRPHNGPVQIQADGKVIPCCFLTNGEIILGDTYKNSIEEILNGRRYDILRKWHELGTLDTVPCGACDQLNNDSPLLYSTVDPSCQVGKTSSTKFKLKEK